MSFAPPEDLLKADIIWNVGVSAAVKLFLSLTLADGNKTLFAPIKKDPRVGVIDFARDKLPEL